MEKILIVEDNESIAELERDYLEANDFATEIVANGSDGLKRALDDDIDLLLLDIMLPGLDGFKICREVREMLEPNPQKSMYIETVWGVGYRFCTGK